MHGALGMTYTPRNRKGRKRKEGRRKPSGDLIHQRVDFRAMAAARPDRVRLPVAYRLDERAESYLGRLNIIWRTSGLPSAIRPGIPDEEYEAGRRYQRIVLAYHRLASAPRLAQLRILAEPSDDPEGMPVEKTIRLNDPDGQRLARLYDDSYVAVSDSAGRDGHMSIKRAVHEEPVSPEHFIHLRSALRGLAIFYGLTNQKIGGGK